MFHKPKPDAETGEDQDAKTEKADAQASQQQDLSIEDEPQQQSANKDATQMAQDSNAKQNESGDTQQQQQSQHNAARQHEGQVRQADIPAGAGAYRGTQQIPNAERMQQQPGTPAAAPYAAAAAQQTDQADSGEIQTQGSAKGRRLVVGQGITMSGEIEACDHLVVEGTVEAALKGASVLEISETCVFYGSVEIDEAVVAGRFEGELSVNGRLSLRSTGAITGTIAYRELAVEAGAVLDGKINPVNGEQSASIAKPAAKGEQQKDSKAKKGADADDTNAGGEELPFSSEAGKDSSAA